MTTSTVSNNEQESGFLASVINAATKGATAIGINDPQVNTQEILRYPRGQTISEDRRSQTISVDNSNGSRMSVKLPPLPPRRRSSVGSSHISENNTERVARTQQALGEGSLSLEELERGFKLAENLNLEVNSNSPSSINGGHTNHSSNVVSKSTSPGRNGRNSPDHLAASPKPMNASSKSLVHSSYVNNPMSARSSSITIKDAEREQDSDALDHHNLISGFAVASKKRNDDFHALFRSVPEDDHLIDDYGAALQKEILIQGRLYVSENHICFNANILGWVTNLIIAFSEVVAIERKNTALFIPNAIQITTLHNKHVFASFISRDTTADLLMNIWRLSHPSINKSPSGTLQRASIEGVNVVYDEKVRQGVIGDHEYDSGDDDEEDEDYEEDDEESTDEDDDKVAGFDTAQDQAMSNQTNGDAETKSGLATAAVTPAMAEGKMGNRPDAKSSGPSKPTQCECGKSGAHYQFVALNKEYTSSVEAFYNLLFTSEFLENFLATSEKATNIDIGKWEKDSEGCMIRKYSYIKALTGSIGPKSTKCYLIDKQMETDFNKAVVILTTTTTPDVPSGGSFAVKTRHCITWGGPHKARLLVTSNVEWSKSSFLKTVIDRSALDGQKVYMEHLDTYLRKYISAHPGEFLDESELKAVAKQKAKKKKVKGTKKKRSSEVVSITPHVSKIDTLGEFISKVIGVMSGVADVVISIPSAFGGAFSAIGLTDALLLLITVMLGLNLWITIGKSQNVLVYGTTERELQEWLQRRSGI